MKNENTYIPYFNKENIKEKNDNYFLKEENIRILDNKKHNNYQDQYLTKQIYEINNKNNSDKMKINDNEIKKNYYSNNNAFINISENNLNENSYMNNFEKLKKMNNNIKNILSNMKNTIQPISKDNGNIKKLDINKYKIFPNDINYNNKISTIERKNINTKHEKNNKGNKKHKLSINKMEIKLDGTKAKDEIDLSKINVNTLNIEQEKKLKELYNIDKDENKIVDIKDLIDNLYEYKIRNQCLENIRDGKKDVNSNIINQTLFNSKKENNALNVKKNFLISEITKSIYNNEKLSQRFKNEIERINSYINKIKFDLENNKRLNKDL